MRKTIFILFLLFGVSVFAQVKGSVTDVKGIPLSSVSVFIENTYIGTTTNEQGQYELKVPKHGKYIIVFQYLGYQTQKVKYNIEPHFKVLDIQLFEENITLNEVVVNKNANPANEIIRNAIASKKDNSENTSKYKADFYSRGIFRIKEAPESILGQKLDMFDEVLDSTRSGILYLSETVSKISFQKPDKLKETIIASKVSGDDNGFSFNNAASANFDFYDNYLPFDVNVISPIADNAFNYYKYKLEGSFFDQNNKEINKIKVTPRRMSEPVMEGYIYIVDDSWAIYAIDLSIRGDQIQNPALNTLSLKQSFTYNGNNKIWIKNTQTLDFAAGILGINISGRFTYVYTNYIFETKFDKKTFTREILSFENNANKKEDNYWNTIRPVPLTIEESTDYLKKDILQTKKKSKVYLDSIDKKNNKWGPFDIITGYTYRNSFEKWRLSYGGFITGFSFNTVQGWRFATDLSYRKEDEEKHSYTEMKMNFDYGLSEERFRVNALYTHKFNNLDQSEIRVSGGSTVSQFNNENPISNFINSVSTLFFKDNFMKIYERNYVNVFFGREVVNGLFMNAALDYAENKPLFNNTDYVIFNQDKLYTSNNPLEPDNYTDSAFEKYNSVKATFNARINFAQEYWSRPDGKINMRNEKYPTLFLGYVTAFAASEKAYEFNQINAKVFYEIQLGNKGNLAMNIKAGKFFNAENIAFVDYQDFNGNQTYVGTQDRYLNVYNLLPYYTNSTNDAYFEAHLEHDDKGYIMNKIPLLNKLKSSLVLGYHNLSIPHMKPYSEVTIGLDNLGFGKFKMFRLDYIRSYQNGFQNEGVIFGLKILNVLE